MPTYDYQCDACEHAFEEFQSMTAKPLRKCPECGKLKLRRLIGTGAGILFKGSGFYETDYRSDSYKKAADADKPKTDGDKAKGDGKNAKKSSDGAASAGDSSTKPAKEASSGSKSTEAAA